MLLPKLSIQGNIVLILISERVVATLHDEKQDSESEHVVSLAWVPNGLVINFWKLSLVRLIGRATSESKLQKCSGKRKAEIRNFDLSFFINKHVVKLDIVVGSSILVDVAQRLNHLCQDVPD